MKKKYLNHGFLCAIIIGICLVMPAVVAAPLEFDIPTNSPCGWATFTDYLITDGKDDVVKYSASGSPGGGTVGSYHKEIDIANKGISIRAAIVPII